MIIDYARVLIRAMAVDYSIMLLSYSVSSGALESTDLLVSYSMIALASHNTIILIITITSIFQSLLSSYKSTAIDTESQDPTPLSLTIPSYSPTTVPRLFTRMSRPLVST